MGGSFMAGFVFCYLLVALLSPGERLMKREERRTYHSSVEPEIRFCNSSLLTSSFNKEEIQASFEKSWRHTLGLHSKLSRMLDKEVFTLQSPWAHFNLLPPVGPKCRAGMMTMGSAGGQDNEKRFCGPRALKRRDCVVISVGSHGEWGFEIGVFESTNCVVHTFDCNGNYSVPPNLQSRVFFHKICLGPVDDGDYRSWPSILKMLGYSRPPTFLKMDIEGWEYSVLTSIINTGYMLPHQIAVELHWYTGGVGGVYWRGPLPTMMENAHRFYMTKDYVAAGYMPADKDPPTYSYKTPGEIALFGAFLFLKGGYMIVDRKDNPDCKHCTELLLARLICSPRSFHGEFTL
ncbi:hypothetical protein GUITHDRAFT_133561 [Guillardia theta CCMP2712]|uniref:Methyltransferase domain-containing protein n=1 Tax=Guillardia theta (strain CCMP2712) TaxID=905079 RepID=L1JWK6_GUITC|nr:hypothetical protein GUITHDRAFT_133561 [Guillardia theta CCMP2712]EKX52478.1 hypothetical protein GUITHDRAFT_133561 [Guillardia theta CCMP2712]|eukprot:XP_005839458.1 hypothetical protein GUITHDRAFT_133561 [Guillardia theta CCMP2712]